MKLNHIAVAVKDFEKGIEIFEKIFGIRPEIIEFKERKLKIGIFHFENIMFELISPMEGEEVVSKFLDKRGDGIHHIAIETEDFENMIKDLESEGFKVISGPRKGVKSERVAFLDPKSTSRVLIEIVKKE